MTTGAEALRHIQQYRQTVGAGLKLGIEHEVGVALYEFILEQRIKTVVETGIAHGFSSWYFLEALSQTGGRLYSIEPHVRASFTGRTYGRRWATFWRVGP